MKQMEKTFNINLLNTISLNHTPRGCALGASLWFGTAERGEGNRRAFHYRGQPLMPLCSARQAAIDPAHGQFDLRALKLPFPNTVSRFRLIPFPPPPFPFTLLHPYNTRLTFAWLFASDFKEKVLLTQTATFRPKGLNGRLYWYALSPLHHFIFEGMLRRIAGKAWSRWLFKMLKNN